MKNNYIILILIVIVSCRTVRFDLSSQKEFQYDAILNNPIFIKMTTQFKKRKMGVIKEVFEVTPYLFFDDGTYLSFSSLVFDPSLMKPNIEFFKFNRMYTRHYDSRWGIYHLSQDSIIAESINNIRYLEDGGNSLKALPAFDTKYIEKFVFLNDSTLIRYEQNKKKEWVLRDTLKQMKNWEIPDIDPSKAWIYKDMLDYPYWKNQKKK